MCINIHMYVYIYTDRQTCVYILCVQDVYPLKCTLLENILTYVRRTNNVFVSAYVANDSVTNICFT